jgi:hypothetical protein
MIRRRLYRGRHRLPFGRRARRWTLTAALVGLLFGGV